MINKLKTKCSTDSCEWKGDLLDFVLDHQKVCGYALEPCYNNGCEITFFKKDILQHEKDCLHQIVECGYCQNYLKKMNKETHESVCSNETVDCLYQDIGCDDKVSRKDAALHKSTNYVKHTELMYQSFKQQQVKSTEEISLLKHQQTKSIEELSFLKHHQLKSTKEIALLKQENSELNEKYVELEKLEKKSNEQLTGLKMKLKTV